MGDTGLGVPLEEQAVIFDEFRQSERTAARGYGGLGVGLAICREIIRLHGGEIGVRSSGLENGGSTFFYCLPTLSPAALQTAGQGALSQRSPLPEADRPGSAPGSIRSQTVMLLAEQAASGELLHAHLAGTGLRCGSTADRGQ